MISSRLRVLQIQRQLRLFNGHSVICQYLRGYSSGNYLQYDKDPGPMFINPKVQKLLKSMTHLEFERIFKDKTVERNQLDFKFMTVEQFEDEVKKAAQRAKKQLQMPPVVKVLEEQKRVLVTDENLSGFCDDKHVITDISFAVKDTNRMVLIRQPDGTLEHAPLEVRKRMNQIFFPRPGRKLKAPKLFEPENLKALLDRHEYLFVLDLLCIQFDPFEKEYHEVSSQVYQHLNESKKFDDLRSTRHFGPMAFFYAYHKMIDDLLLDNIKRDYLRHGVELILLQHTLHGNVDEEKAITQKLAEFPDRRNLVKDYCELMLRDTQNDLQVKIKQVVGKSEEDFAGDECFVEIIEDFTKKHSLKKMQLELALQTFKEENRMKYELSQSLKKQHGVAG